MTKRIARKKLILILSSLFIFLAASGQTKGRYPYFIDTSSVPGYEWESINIGFPESSDPEQITASPSVIRIDTISRQDFLDLTENYSTKTVPDSSFITTTDTSFTLRTENFQNTFEANRICECTASYYGGLIAPLNLFIVGTVDMHNEIAWASLIDKQTGKTFEVPCAFDEGPQDISLSPGNGFLLTYSSTYYEHDNAAVYILKVNRNSRSKSFTLNNYLNVNFDRLHIDGATWVNENTFVMTVTEQLNPEDDDNHKVQYCLKVTVAEDLMPAKR